MSTEPGKAPWRPLIWRTLGQPGSSRPRSTRRLPPPLQTQKRSDLDPDRGTLGRSSCELFERTSNKHPALLGLACWQRFLPIGQNQKLPSAFAARNTALSASRSGGTSLLSVAASADRANHLFGNLGERGSSSSRKVNRALGKEHTFNETAL